MGKLTRLAVLTAALALGLCTPALAKKTKGPTEIVKYGPLALETAVVHPGSPGGTSIEGRAYRTGASVERAR